MIALAVDDGLRLADDVLENGNRLVLIVAGTDTFLAKFFFAKKEPSPNGKKTVPEWLLKLKNRQMFCAFGENAYLCTKF